MWLSIVIYPLHLWFVGLAASAPLLSLWFEWSGRRDAGTWDVNRRLSRIAWISLLIGTALGFLHGIMLWDEAWKLKVVYAGSRIFFGVIELLTSLVLMIAYDLWLSRKQKPSPALGFVRWLFPLVASTNLLYHFPALFGVLQQIDADYISQGARLTSSAFRELLLSGRVVSTAIHFFLTSFGLTTIVALVLSHNLSNDELLRGRLQKRLAWLSAAATCSQWIAGPSVFVYISRTKQLELTGGDLLLTGWFFQTLLLAFLLSVLQIRLVRHFSDKSLAQLVGLLQFAVIFSMCLLTLVQK